MWILHAAYAWIPVGLALLALSHTGVLGVSATAHAQTMEPGTQDFRFDRFRMARDGHGINDFNVGPDYANYAADTYFNMRKTSIYGGSNEIQRNIISKMILGL